MKKIIILGSNSYLGASFVRYMQDKNYNLYLISRSKILPKRFLPFKIKNKNIKFYKLDINKDLNKIITFIKNKKPAFIINYASQSMVGQSWEEPGDWLMTNSVNTVKLYLEISKLKLKTKLIHISTPEIYGHTKKIIKENREYAPSTPYALSRVNADLTLDMLKKNFGLESVSLRASNIYGEYQKNYRVVSGAVLKFLTNKKFFIDGDGSSKRSFLHVDDLSSATFLLMKKFKSGNIYHVSTNDFISIKNLAKLISKLTNKKFEANVKFRKDRVGKDKSYFLDSKKIRKLGWRPKVSLEEGIKRVILWAASFKKKFKNEDFIYQHKK
tara:strand:- start:9493 stop:10473 length:981 start_codon:yes stop_codon:yes gene_type:complete